MTDPVLYAEQPGGLKLGAVTRARQLSILHQVIAEASRADLVDALIEARLGRHGQGDLDRLLRDLMERLAE